MREPRTWLKITRKLIDFSSIFRCPPEPATPTAGDMQICWSVIHHHCFLVWRVTHIMHRQSNRRRRRRIKCEHTHTYWSDHPPKLLYFLCWQNNCQWIATLENVDFSLRTSSINWKSIIGVCIPVCCVAFKSEDCSDCLSCSWHLIVVCSSSPKSRE